MNKVGTYIRVITLLQKTGQIFGQKSKHWYENYVKLVCRVTATVELKVGVDLIWVEIKK